MKLNSSLVGNVVILAPAGRIDHNTADALAAALEPWLARCSPSGEGVVLDFSAISHVSTVGLRMLMTVVKRVESQQGSIAIAAVQPKVHEVFEISHFNRIFKLFNTVHEATEALG